MNLSNRIDPSHSALIVVDVQNDFCHAEGSLAKQGADVGMVDSMMPQLHRVIGRARELNVPIIFIQTIHENSTDSAVWTSRLKNKNQAGVCRKNTWGADFFEVDPEDDIVVIKHRYSAFINTRLDSVLRTLNIKTILMTGVSTNVCVESTARDGYMLDYDVVFLSDCAAAYSREAHDMTLKNMDEFFGSVADSKQIENAWMEAGKPASAV